MFPNLDKDVIEDVVRLKEGRLVFQNHLLVRQLLTSTPGLVWLLMLA